VIPAVDAGPGCVVERAEVRLEGEGDRVAAELDLDVASDGECRRLSFPLPEGAVLGELEASERRNDGTRVRLDATRWALSARAPDGGATATLHVPDLWARDHVRVRLVREQVPAEVARAWAEGRAGAAPTPLAAAVPTRRERTLTLLVPPGDPQLALHPEGAASSHVDESWTLPPSEVERAFVPELPPGIAPQLRAEPAGAAELVAVGGVWQVRVPASEGAARLVVSWDDPRCPTHGERGDLDALAVRVEGEVTWEGDRWTLTRVGDRVVLPSRDALVRGLDRRFRSAAIPEPGVPSDLRGAPATDALLAELRPVLAVRAPTLAHTAVDPLFVRPLAKARRAGALTPTEAAVTLWLYARQLRFDAHWALARPAPTETLPPGAPEPLSPAGYTAPLLVVVTPEGDRWIDPTCGSCAPFELPPALEGARVLSPSGRVRTPEPTPGAVRVDVTGDAVTLEAEGAPALLLRRALSEVPASARADALAEAVAGPGARLREVAGLDTGGAPLRVVATPGAGPVPDPAALPSPSASGDWWFDWIGTRTFTHPGDAVPREVALDGLRDVVTVADGRVTHALSVTERRIVADLAAFAPPPAPEPAVSPLPPDPAPPSPTSGSSSP
jgi:hypothetical protein